ncbi:MAG TPA: CPBP family intramembrane glutamic endopeptidase [Candidatus Angelobacter sp.]
MLAIFAFAFFALVVIGGLALGVAHSLPSFRNIKLIDLAQTPIVLVPAQAVAYVLVVAFMVQIVRLRHGNGFLRAISWNWPSTEKILLAIGGGAGLALSSEIFFNLTSRWVPKSLPIDKFFRDTTSTYLLALFGITFAPLVEELFFRGFLYPALARRIGMGASVVLTAASFAVLHQGQLAHAWIPLTWLFLVGTVLTVVRARTRSVALCVVIHVGYNATLFTLVFIGTQGFHHLDKV